MKKRFVAILITLAVAGTTGLAAATGHAASLHGLRFVSALEFSAPEKAGLDALRVDAPKDARPGAEKMSIMAVRFPKKAVGEGGMSDGELLDYVKTVFLAKTGAGKPVTREFLGRKARGEAFAKSIPAPALAEVYVVALNSGDKVVLGFTFDPGFAVQAGEAIAEIAATLTE